MRARVSGVELDCRAVQSARAEKTDCAGDGLGLRLGRIAERAKALAALAEAEARVRPLTRR